ncbi:hypothetical protein EON82_13545 [bacterium]|nr:MAG: hypothetical protein EON82_13545 [bacterium]
MAAVATLQLERKSDRDIKRHDIFVRLDDLPEETLHYGDTWQVPLTPGEHHLQVTSRLYHVDETFTVHEGETVRFSTVAVLKKGLLNFIAMTGGGLVYKPTLERI